MPAVVSDVAFIRKDAMQYNLCAGVEFTAGQ